MYLTANKNRDFFLQIITCKINSNLFIISYIIDIQLSFEIIAYKYNKLETFIINRTEITSIPSSIKNISPV